MTDTKWAAVDQYLNELLIGRDAALDGAVQASVAAGLPPIAVAPNQGKLLHLLARMLRAHSILEIGTLGGYSTIWLARGLEPDGKVVTLEIDRKHADVAAASIANAGLSDTVEIHVGKAIDTLPQLEHSGDAPFDLVFIDADKKSIPEYFEWALRLSRIGTLIIVDNVIRDGAVVDADSPDADVQGVRRFNEILAREPRVTATTIQTVGSKGYDGLAFVLVTG
ncbi:MAG: methyltransferase [Gemmatimonadetes bacterium]|jgi:predicted O-methyltransferase YrrM|nr:methyltransferase [Gemmatimonadota bacterium]